MKSVVSIHNDIKLMQKFNDEYFAILLNKMKHGDIRCAVFDQERLFLDFDTTHQALLIGTDVKDTVHILCSQEFIRKNIIFSDKFKSNLDWLKNIDTTTFMLKPKGNVLWKVTHDVVNQMVYAATNLYNTKKYDMAVMTLTQAYKHTIGLEFDSKFSKINKRCYISGFLLDILVERTHFNAIYAIQWATKYAQNIQQLGNCVEKLDMKCQTQLEKHIKFYELSARLINNKILKKGFGHFSWDFDAHTLIFSTKVQQKQGTTIYGCNRNIIEIIYDPTKENEQKQIISQIESKCCNWCDSIYLSAIKFWKSFQKTDMYLCKKCKQAWYCSKRCQKFAWSSHKEYCIV